MHKKPLIGLLGQAGVGKDTMADHLVKQYGFVKIPLADPLKRACREIYDFTDEQLWGPSAERNKPDLRYPDGKGGFLTPRKALQVLGTEWGRTMWEDTWISYGLRQAELVLNKNYTYNSRVGAMPISQFLSLFGMGQVPRGVVISDMRFRNEAKAIMDRGGIVVRIRRAISEVTGGVANHPSEEEQKTIMDAELNGGVIEAPDGVPSFKSAIDTWLRKPSLGVAESILL